MVGAGYTLLHNAHVRVDIFYRPSNVRYKAMVDLFGSLLLLLPVTLVVTYASYGFVLDSWMRLDQSRAAGGLPALLLQIGRASCGESVCLYVSISVVAVSFKKKKPYKQTN